MRLRVRMLPFAIEGFLLRTIRGTLIRTSLRTPMAHTPLEIRDETVIQAHDMAPKKERNEEWYVGREDTGTFVALPELWVQAVIYMANPNPFTHQYPSFAAVKAFLRAKTPGETEFHAELDRELRLLIGQLVRHRLIRAIGTTVLDEHEGRRDLLPSIRARHIRWLFSPVALGIQASMILVALLALAIVPALRPQLSHYFWSAYPGLTFLTALGSAWLLTLQHELFHVLAARAYRLSGTLSFSTRGPSVIMEANIHNLPKAHSAVRRLVYAAGIHADLLVVALGTFTVWGEHQGLFGFPAWGVGILRQIILLRLIGFIWQGILWFRTDISSILQDLYGDPSLHRKARGYLVELWDRVRHPTAGGPMHLGQRSWPPVTPSVKRFALALAVMTIGCGLSALTIKVILLAELITRSGRQLAGVGANSLLSLADGLTVLLLLLGMLALNIRTRLREHRTRAGAR